jgi:hypothetical protein
MIACQPAIYPYSNEEDHDRFSTSAICHELLRPITLMIGHIALYHRM